MNTDLQTAKAALAGMTDAELRPLIDAARRRAEEAVAAEVGRFLAGKLVAG